MVADLVRQRRLPALGAGPRDGPAPLRRGTPRAGRAPGRRCHRRARPRPPRRDRRRTDPDQAAARAAAPTRRRPGRPRPTPRRARPGGRAVRTGSAVTRPPENGVGGPADELGRLRTQIVELDRALTAIRAGDVDAVVLAGPQGHQLYTLVSADRPYRVIVEEMGDGAVTVSERGIILYANLRLADLIGVDRAELLGREVTELVDASAATTLLSLLATTPPGTTRQEELELLHADGSVVPVLASVTGLDI